MWRDSETNIDYLNVNYLIGLLKDIIDDDSLAPASIGVYGDWGSGKSSLIEMSLDSLKDEEDVLTVKFNGWLFEGYDDAKSVLLSTILDEIKAKRTIHEKAKKVLRGLYNSVDKIKLAKGAIKFGADYLLTGGMVTAAKQGINNIKGLVTDSDKLTDVPKEKIEEVISNIEDELNFSDVRNDISSFRKNFSMLLKETKTKKLVVYIDELDRCNPETILETLEAIRLFLFVENTYFIIGADERHIQYSVQRKFSDIEGNKISIGKEYLEKIIQYPIHIHQMRAAEVEFYIFCLLSEKNVSEEYGFLELRDYLVEQKKENLITFDLFSAISKNSTFSENDQLKENYKLASNLAIMLSSGLNGNPRQCKRFLNTMESRLRMGRYNNISLDKLLLSKLMLLEYFRQDIFELLLNAINSGDEKSSIILDEFYKLEKNDKIEINNKILQEFKSTVWGKAWIKMDPRVEKKDLQPYFYFSRDKIQGVENLLTFRLSPTGKKVMSLLLSHTHKYKDEVEVLAGGIQQNELEEILSTLFKQQISKSEIINALEFSVFLFWGSITPSLVPNLIGYLKMIPANNRSVSLAPYLIETEKRLSDANFTTLIDEWCLEKGQFGKALKAEREKK